MVGEVSCFWKPAQYINTKLQFCISLIFMFLFETSKHKTANHIMIMFILVFVYSAKIRTIKIGLVTLCSFVFRRLSQLVWEKFVLGDNLMRTMEQIRSVVSGRLDINIILKWLEFT